MLQSFNNVRYGLYHIVSYSIVNNICNKEEEKIFIKNFILYQCDSEGNLLSCKSIYLLMSCVEMALKRVSGPVVHGIIKQT